MKIMFVILRCILILIFFGVLFMLWGFGPVMSLWLRLALSLVAFALFYPEIHKIFKLNNNIKFAVSICILLITVTVWHSFVIRSFYQKIFEQYIAKPIPSQVKLIKGDNGRWLDSETYFIFETDASTFQVISKNYKETPIAVVSEIISEFSKYVKNEPWKKKGIKCYLKIEEGSTRPDRKGKVQHYKREYYLLWDEAIGRAYFYRPYTRYE